MADDKELMQAVAALTTQVTNLAARVEEIAKQSTPAEIAGLKRTVAELGEAFNQMKGVTKAAIEERERERQYLVHELAGNARVTFAANELEAMPIDTLRKLAASVDVANFAGRGGPGGSGDGAAPRYAAPRPYWDKDKDDASKGGK